VFSSRLPPSFAPNRLTVAVSSRKRPFLDLTLSNPTLASLDYTEGYLGALANPVARIYDPDPRGLAGARDAVLRSYRRHGVEVREDRIVLSASSSEAYSWLFKLLANPGDVVLVPAPSYPLLDALAGLESLAVHRYPLDRSHRWAVSAHLVAHEVDSLKAAGCRPAAIVLVNPNNPTGTSIDRDEFEALLDLAEEHGIAVISDEVFLDYRFDSSMSSIDVAAARASRGLVFSLGGLSKAAGMPHLKAGWIVAGGDQTLTDDAMARLEWIADSFLSISTPVQVGLDELLNAGAMVAADIKKRLRKNHGTLCEVLGPVPGIDVAPLTGGWSAVVRVPAVIPEEEMVLRLLEEADVLVHPGFFFDFPFEAFLVVSLLCPEGVFREGTQRLAGFLERL
jgi:aspartate/methionine/tyrosine aminotransferase